MEKIKQAIIKGFTVAHANLPLLVVILGYNIVLAVLALVIIGRAPQAVTPGATEAGAIAIRGLIYNLISLALWVFVQGGLLNLLKTAVVSSTQQDLGLFWEGGQKFYIPLLILTLILVVPLVIILGVMGGLTAASAAGASPILGIFLVLAAVILIAYIIFLFFVMLAPYEVVIGLKDAVSGIKGSFALIKKNLGPALLLLVLMILIGLGIGFLLGIIMGIINALFAAVPVIVTLVTVLFTSVINAYVVVVVTSAFTNFYLSISTKTETQTAAPIV